MNARAWCLGYAAATLLALGLVAAALPDDARPEEPGACRAAAPAPGAKLACLGGQKADVLAIELAGDTAAWRCLLRRETPADAAVATVRAAECAELRIARWREAVQGFDARIFIPLYVTLSLLAAAWLAARARAPAAGSAGPVTAPRLFALAAALALVTVAMGLLDGRENRALLALLKAADALGAQWQLPWTGELDALAARARRASLVKWAFTAAWAPLLALTLAAALRRSWSAARAAPAWWRWAVRVLPWLGLLGAALMAIGVAQGWGGRDIAAPARWLSAGVGVGWLLWPLAGIAAARAGFAARTDP